MVMKVEPHPITVGKVFNGFEDDAEEGVHALDGNLDIRPPYQREFVYDLKKQQNVILSVLRNLPLNVMYWAITNDNRYEVLDGQQRTLSLMKYIDGDYTIHYMNRDLIFDGLPTDLQQRILNYKLLVYTCQGTDSDKLEWFQTVNIAGEKLTDQELRNAVFAGPWTADAKRYFSRTGCAASRYGNNEGAEGYLKGSPIRQDMFQTVLEWAADKNGITIDHYMGNHQKDTDAKPLWQYFRNVIDWTEQLFTVYRKEMKGLPWGIWYNKFHKKINANQDQWNPDQLEKHVEKLMADYDVTRKAGIYEYILTGSERALSIRKFDERTIRSTYEKQKGICPICHKHYPLKDMQADHIIPWSKGGKTVPENCQMLCRKDNLAKSDITIK